MSHLRWAGEKGKIFLFSAWKTPLFNSRQYRLNRIIIIFRFSPVFFFLPRNNFISFEDFFPDVKMRGDRKVLIIFVASKNDFMYLILGLSYFQMGRNPTKWRVGLWLKINYGKDAASFRFCRSFFYYFFFLLFLFCNKKLFIFFYV